MILADEGTELFCSRSRAWFEGPNVAQLSQLLAKGVRQKTKGERRKAKGDLENTGQYAQDSQSLQTSAVEIQLPIA